MNTATERITLNGPVGAIEALIDRPAHSPVHSPAHLSVKGQVCCVAVVAHPHPLFAGTMDNKVVQTVARACVTAGHVAVRFNFRGVGASAGVYDAAKGETDDFLAVVSQIAPDPATPLILAGFSFGTVVVSRAIAQLQANRVIHKIALVGTAVSRFEVAPIPPELHARTLVLHGEHDDTVPLADVMSWARPQELPVTVFPAGAHFFHGQLPLLKEWVLRHLSSA